MTFDTILIVGCGLIGSSIARAARHFGAAKTILMSDQSADVCARVSALNMADAVSQNAGELTRQADLVILCVPAGAMEACAKSIIPVMKSGAVLSDVGSIKGAVVDTLSPLLRADISLVPGHPIAGTENSGPEAGFAGLFNVGIMGFVALGGLATVLVSMPATPGAWQAGGGPVIGALLLGAATVVAAGILLQKMKVSRLIS